MITTATIILAVIVLAMAGILFIRARKAHLPAGWTAITDGNDYGTKVDASGSFDFPQAPNSVHYVTKGCDSLANAKGLRLRYSIDADPGTQFLLMQLVEGRETPVAKSIGQSPVLFFQRADDDWSGAGEYEAYRWWATFNQCVPLAPGEYEVTAMFDQRWTAVEHSTALDHAAAFKEALANASRVGFTFPGESGFGHGATATGNARFNLKSFEIL